MIAIPTLTESLVTPWVLPPLLARFVAPSVSAASTSTTMQSDSVAWRRGVRAMAMVPPGPRLLKRYNDRDAAATWRLLRPVVLAPGLRHLGTLAVAGVLDGRHQLPVAR